MKQHQRDLFSDYTPDPPSQVHSQTSRAAAEEIAPRAETLRLAVLEFIRSRGETGATDEQVQEALGLSGSTQRPRRIECVEMGLLRDSGQTRPTRSGRSAVVWTATMKEAPK